MTKEWNVRDFLVMGVTIMCKVVVVYQSKYGTTKKYADWIANLLKADVLKANETKPEQLLKYDTIIYGGYLFGVRIKGFDLIKKNYQALKDKQILVFSVGLASIHETMKKQISDVNFTDEMKERLALFPLRGGMDFQNLTFIDKTAMKMMHKMITKKKPEELTEDDKGFLEAYNKTVDFTDEKQVLPIVDAILNQ